MTTLVPYTHYDCEQLIWAVTDKYDDPELEGFVDKFLQDIADGCDTLVWLDAEMMIDTWTNWEWDAQDYPDFAHEDWEFAYLAALAEFLDEEFGTQVGEDRWYEASIYYWYNT